MGFSRQEYWNGLPFPPPGDLPDPPSIRVYSNESTLCMRWPKYWYSWQQRADGKACPHLIPPPPAALGAATTTDGVHPGPSAWPHSSHQTPSRYVLCLRPSPLPLEWLLASSPTHIPWPGHPSGLSASLPASRDVFRFDSLEPPSSG